MIKMITRTRPERGAAIIPAHHQDVVYLPNGIEAKRYDTPIGVEQVKRDWHIPLGKTVIGTLARMVTQKNPMMFVDMARCLMRTYPNIHFVMVGDGALRRQVEDAIARYGLQEVFTLVGTQRDIATWLGVFDIFVLTSEWEGLPNAVMEAMCARLPIVATAVGGVPELLIHGQSGLLVAPDDVQGLARGVASLLLNRQVQVALGRRGREVIEMHYTLERIVDANDRIYHQLLSGLS
ncbi:hypothetical protein C2W62_22885 [Candidatus Entotheonella serta]|nr:hypothetical protein C2W62_22885 [Candidatus Entotheonella serta]